MDNLKPEDIAIPTFVIRQTKSLFWKVGMFFSVYFSTLIVSSILFVFIMMALAMIFSESVLDVLTNYPLPFQLMAVIIGLLGILLAVNFVAKRVIIEAGDVTKIILWFVIVSIGLTLLDIEEIGIIELIFSLLILVIECFAIKFFFEKTVKKA